MKCKDCKFWTSPEELQDYPTGIGVGKCNRVKMFWDNTYWDDEFERALKPSAADHKAFVQDGSDYKASLLTKEDFGCVQFEVYL